MSALGTKQLTFLIYGLVFWLPVAIALYIVFLPFGNFENIGKANLLEKYLKASGSIRSVS
jgi:hypothetical protein